MTNAIIVEAAKEGASEYAAKQFADLKKPAVAETAERQICVDETKVVGFI